MITKQISIDQITLIENGIILYRECSKILEDGVQLTHSYHRSSLTPGQDISTVPEKVKKICDVVWTPQVIEEYKKSLKKE